MDAVSQETCVTMTPKATGGRRHISMFRASVATVTSAGAHGKRTSSANTLALRQARRLKYTYTHTQLHLSCLHSLLP